MTVYIKNIYTVYMSPTFKDCLKHAYIFIKLIKEHA